MGTHSIGGVHGGRYQQYITIQFPSERRYSFRTSFFLRKKVLVVTNVCEDWDMLHLRRIRRKYIVTRDATTAEAADVMQQLHFVSRIKIVDAKRAVGKN